MRIKLTGPYRGFEGHLRYIQFVNGESVGDTSVADRKQLDISGIPYEILPTVCPVCEARQAEVITLTREVQDLREQLQLAKRKVSKQ